MIHFVLMRCLLLASTMGPSLDGRAATGLLFVWLSCLTLLRGLLTLSKARFQHVRFVFFSLFFESCSVVTNLLVLLERFSC